MCEKRYLWYALILVFVSNFRIYEKVVIRHKKSVFLLIIYFIYNSIYFLYYNYF